MKKKIFFQFGVGAIVRYLSTMSLMIFIVFITGYFKSADRYYLLIIGIIGVSITVYILCGLLIQRIVFNDNYIYAPKNLFLFTKLQHKIKVNYNQIVNIYMINDSKNSLGKELSSSVVAGNNWKYHNFLILTSINGKKIRLCLFSFSLNQKIKIIDELKLRIKNAVIVRNLEKL